MANRIVDGQGVVYLTGSNGGEDAIVAGHNVIAIGDGTFQRSTNHIATGVAMIDAAPGAPLQVAIQGQRVPVWVRQLESVPLVPGMPLFGDTVAEDDEPNIVSPAVDQAPGEYSVAGMCMEYVEAPEADAFVKVFAIVWFSIIIVEAV